jgi:hypothetical protein
MPVTLELLRLNSFRKMMRRIVSKTKLWTRSLIPALRFYALLALLMSRYLR